MPNKGVNLPPDEGFELTPDELAAIQNANSPSAANPFATIADIPGLIVEPLDLVPVPKSLDDNQGTRQAQTNYDGSWFSIPFPITFNTFQFEVT